MRVVFRQAPQADLWHLARLDERLAAHLDGLAVAGADAWPFCEAALETGSPGALFTAAVHSMAGRHDEKLAALFSLAKTAPNGRGELLWAIGWLECDQSHTTVAAALRAAGGFERAIATAACGVHGVDAGPALLRALQDGDSRVRADGFRTAGVTGRRDLLHACATSAHEADPDVQFWASWSAVLLGDRSQALDTLLSRALGDGAHRGRAFQVALQAMGTGAAHAALRQLAARPDSRRCLIQGSGIAGDPAYVPWLISHMEKPETARAAGEAFSTITGADLDALQLYREHPDGFESEPSDDPDHPDVAMDADEGLPWPDHTKVAHWWSKHAGRFATGTRYFMGVPVTRAHCLEVLKNGYQRQRILAAHYLCLLEPGTPLFNTGAPAWRQRALLASME